MAQVNEYITAAIIALVLILVVGGALILPSFPELQGGIMDTLEEVRDIFREEWDLTSGEVASRSEVTFDRSLDSVESCIQKEGSGCTCVLDRGDFSDRNYNVVIENFEDGVGVVLVKEEEIISQRDILGGKIGTLVSVENPDNGNIDLYCFYGRISIKYADSVEDQVPVWLFTNPLSGGFYSYHFLMDKDEVVSYELLKTSKGVCLVTNYVDDVKDVYDWPEYNPNDPEPSKKEIGNYYFTNSDKELIASLDSDTGFLWGRTDNTLDYLRSLQSCEDRKV